MDRSSLKNFVLNARQELTNLVIAQAANWGITSEEIAEKRQLTDGMIINGKIIDTDTAKNYDHLVKRIELIGYQEVIKEATYTWFNRFVALRYMELHDYLPIRTRILSSVNEVKNEPDALTEVNYLMEELDMDKDIVYKLQDEHRTDELFKYLIEKQSRQLETMIPNVFDRIEHDLFLLLPDGLLKDNGFIEHLVRDIPEEDWTEIEIIGWLYQYYISEEKNDIFANIRKQKIGKNEIGPATQIFTPKWIVQYLVDNSLGRLWIEHNPDTQLRDYLPYYIEDAEQSETVVQQLENVKGRSINPEEIKVMDPSMGSGHMLLEAFEVLKEIYLEQGYRIREIPKLILENNLYGLDIDKRAAQLANFVLVMKARSYDRRFFEQDVRLHLLGFEESNDLPLIENVEIINLDEANKELEKLYENFRDAKLFGSIIKLKPVNVVVIEQALIDVKDISINDIFAQEFLEYSVPYIAQLIHQYQLLSQKYHVTVTNPPYMGNGSMDDSLSKYVKKHYPISKSDLSTVMMEVEFTLTKENYYTAMINQHSWMFLSSYVKLRKWIVPNKAIVNMVHTGTRTFPEVSGEVVQSVSFIIKNNNVNKFIGNYVRLVNYEGKSKQIEALNKENYHTVTQEDFEKIPGSPVAYWVSNNIISKFKENKIGDYLITREGMATANNDLFLKFWFEVSEINSFYRDNKRIKWFPYNKGGSYRKWYGNNEYVVNWENDGDQIKRNVNQDTGKVRSHNYNGVYSFKEGITWSAISTGDISIRYSKEGFLFDSKGAMGFERSTENIKNILSFLNSKVAMKFLEFISPTMDFKVGDIITIPYILETHGKSYKQLIEKLSENNITISKSDWDSFETSWDFKKHPIITYKENNETIQESFQKWTDVAEYRFNQLKANEEELNQIFIGIYDLQDELTPQVEEKDVTVRKANLTRDVKSFLSYLVGIIFGRYSLDEPGLIYAGGEFNQDRYHKYQPDKDNIIPITDEHYFEDDIVTRIIELVKIIFGEQTVEENVQFIAEAIGIKNDENSRDTIRRYFMKDFFKDHKKIYQNRPVYWQMTSGKQDAFKGLIYLHRYESTTLARVRTDYVLPLTNTITELMRQAQLVIDGSGSSKEVAKAQKTKEKYQKQLQELRDYDLILKNLADKEIELDLDDGVKVNYEKFQNVPVIGTSNQRMTKMNLFEKI